MNKKIIGILFCVLLINSFFPVVSSIDSGFSGNLSNADMAYRGIEGIVPAMYINSNTCMNGKGTKKDPYILKL